MAKFRSKQQRIKAKHRRLSNQAPTNSSTVKTIVNQADQRFKSILDYDLALIFKDLRKTILVMGFILLVLLAITLIYT